MIGRVGSPIKVQVDEGRTFVPVHLIAEEDAAKPLSDNAIARLLEKSGARVARRTVAKYRESLGIPSSSERRRAATL